MTKRLQFDVPEDRVKDIDKLVADCNLDSRKALFNDALTMFEWAVNEIREGNEIASVNEERKKYRVLQMTSLQAIARKAYQRLHPKIAASA